ncbi:hypothetical protein OQZ33_18305 [Pedobacter sp. MC2016-05]|uniref:hypothetical protein n=1 Tax=Pedobacter sp. MC2016-05 TaxID=2994474 RepID=UPI00224541E9|nr:hypothetical protein [Pedobacter sp. MC2016-05]MCX2476293.1 hypothetical protein [Pedobacter sp. MC2016-05]
MKLLIIFFTSVTLLLVQSSELVFQKPVDFTYVTSDDSDFTKIVSDEQFEYWECVYNPTMFEPIKAKRNVVATSGNRKYEKIARRISSRTGFFVSCGPAFCSYYIVAVKKDKSVSLINNKSAFRGFIGNIDNVEEAKLGLRNNGFNVTSRPPYQPSYAQIDDYYMFKLYDFGLPTCLGLPIGHKPQMINVKVNAAGDCFKL